MTKVKTAVATAKAGTLDTAYRDLEVWDTKFAPIPKMMSAKPSATPGGQQNTVSHCCFPASQAGTYRVSRTENDTANECEGLHTISSRRSRLITLVFLTNSRAKDAGGSGSGERG